LLPTVFALLEASTRTLDIDIDIETHAKRVGWSTLTINAKRETATDHISTVALSQR
jgi:hypothetical protein